MDPETEQTTYTIVPKFNKSFVEIGHYSGKILSTGKIPTIKYTTEWRWGECVVHLTKEEKNSILLLDYICLNDYDCEFSESSDGWCAGAELEDENSYTEDEMREIVESACEPNEDEDEIQEIVESACEPNEDEKLTLDDCTQDGLENGGWDLDETYYYIDGGCVLVPEGKDIEDYAQDDGSYANKEEPVVSVFDTLSLQV